jgi:lysine 2,3-aminomutase
MKPMVVGVREDAEPAKRRDGTTWYRGVRETAGVASLLRERLQLTDGERRGIDETRFACAVTPHLLGLMDPDDPACPIRRQFVPHEHELASSADELVDPCGEERHMQAPWLVHRYPDRVLLLLTDRCAAYCRFCTRKRLVGHRGTTLPDDAFAQALAYLRSRPEVRDVLLSGGDPLMLTDGALEGYLEELRRIPHIELLRIGTRMPVAMPDRVTPRLCAMLKRFHPLFVNVHVNHPKELSEASCAALGRLADAGIPLGSQTVLLRGINDDAAVIARLVHGLVRNRVRPYYLYQCDLAPGTAHFRTPVARGIDIVEKLRGYTTGLAVPTFVIDAPGGGGKIPVNPDYVVSRTRRTVILRNYENQVFMYHDIR